MLSTDTYWPFMKDSIEPNSWIISLIGTSEEDYVHASQSAIFGITWICEWSVSLHIFPHHFVCKRFHPGIEVFQSKSFSDMVPLLVDFGIFSLYFDHFAGCSRHSKFPSHVMPTNLTTLIRRFSLWRTFPKILLLSPISVTT